MLRPLKRQTLTAHAYDELLSAISSGRLQPGQKLVIDAISRELDVSITPVREAVGRLLREGLLTEVPFAGVYVSSPSDDELRELCAIRGVLEGYAVRLAADRLSDDELRELKTELIVLDDLAARGDVSGFINRNSHFHGLILSRSGGESLPALIAQFARNTDRYADVATLLDLLYISSSQAEHHKLVDLLSKRDGAAAELLARNHAIMYSDNLARVRLAARNGSSPD